MIVAAIKQRQMLNEMMLIRKGNAVFFALNTSEETIDEWQ
jgi:hypothetical protein